MRIRVASGRLASRATPLRHRWGEAEPRTAAGYPMRSGTPNNPCHSVTCSLRPRDPERAQDRVLSGVRPASRRALAAIFRPAPPSDFLRHVRTLKAARCRFALCTTPRTGSGLSPCAFLAGAVQDAPSCVPRFFLVIASDGTCANSEMRHTEQALKLAANLKGFWRSPGQRDATTRPAPSLQTLVGLNNRSRR